MSNFEFESRGFAESGGDVSALLASCPFAEADPELPGAELYYLGGKDLLQSDVMQESVTLKLSSGLGCRSTYQAKLDAYERARRFYDWLCEKTAFDWELYFDFAQEETPNRYRPSWRYPHPEVPFTEEDDFVYDAPWDGDVHSQVVVLTA